MSWETITAFLDKISNNPIVITIVGILSLFIPLFTLFAKTSFGKKAIEQLTSLYQLGYERAIDTLKKVEDVEKLANEKIKALVGEYEQKCVELKQECEQKVACALSIVNFYEESVFYILDQIPNAKVQNLLQEFKEKYKEKKWEISQIVSITYQDYNEHIELVKQEVRAEYDEKIDFLENQIAQLTLYLNEVKGGSDDGEGKESENSDTGKEEIQGDQ